MLSQTQIDAMALGNNESNVIDMPPVKTEREKEIDEDVEAKTKIDALPFTSEALGAEARAQYERRLPLFLDSTEKQIRQLVTFGERWPELNTKGSSYHAGVVALLKDKGFKIIETESGFKVDLSE